MMSRWFKNRESNAGVENNKYDPNSAYPPIRKRRPVNPELIEMANEMINLIQKREQRRMTEEDEKRLEELYRLSAELKEK